MRIKVLMTGERTADMAIEAEMLKNKGLMVYTCNPSNTEAFMDEVIPDVVYFNVAGTSDCADIYHHVLDNAKFMNIPVIYTLLEDDIYLVNKKRNTYSNHRHVICDNILDAIKASVTGMEKIYSRPVKRPKVLPAFTNI